MENWQKVVVYCNDALDLDSKSVKALYRRALAFEKQNRFEEAERDAKVCSLFLVGSFIE